MLGTEGVVNRTGKPFSQYLSDSQKKRKDCDNSKIRNPKSGKCAECIGSTFTLEELQRYCKSVGLDCSGARDKYEVCDILFRHLGIKEISYFDIIVNNGVKLFNTLSAPTSAPKMGLFSAGVPPTVPKMSKLMYVPFLMVNTKFPMPKPVTQYYLEKDKVVGLDSAQKAQEKLARNLGKLIDELAKGNIQISYRDKTTKQISPIPKKNLVDFAKKKREIITGQQPFTYFITDKDGNIGGNITFKVDKVEVQSAKSDPLLDLSKLSIFGTDDSSEPVFAKRKPEAQAVLSWTTVPGGRVVTYKEDKGSVMVDKVEITNVPATNVYTEGDPKSVYIQARPDVGIYVGETIRPELTAFKFKFAPGDKFVRYDSGKLGGPPLVFGEKYVYLLDRGQMIPKIQYPIFDGAEPMTSAVI